MNVGLFDAANQLPVISPAYLATLQKVLPPNEFDIIILPTEKCNFRCTYCYEDFVLGQMQRPTVEGLLRLLSTRAPELDILKLSWFGGEPLLALPIVLEISRHAQAVCIAHDTQYSFGMTTNGFFLTENTFTALIAAGVKSFQITLDGPKDIHNMSRLKKDGSGSFERVWSNLKCISKLARSSDVAGFRINIRVHYDARTAYFLQPLIEMILSDLAYESFFSLHFHGIERLGGPNDEGLAPPSEREHAFVREMIAGLDPHNLLRSSLAIDGTDDVCYAAKASSLVVRADGSIGKCTVALHDARNTIGSLRADGTIDVRHSALIPWLRGLFSNSAEELACPWHQMPEQLYGISSQSSV